MNDAEKDEQNIQRLLKNAGAPTDIAPEREQRVYQAVHASWKQQININKKQTKSWPFKVAALAAVFLCIVLVSWQNQKEFSPKLIQVGEVVALVGKANTKGSHSEKIKLNQIFFVGQTISTGANSGLALRIGEKQSLRLDANSEIVFETPRQLRLQKGALYFDSMLASDAPLTVLTDHGQFSDIGTQFELRQIGQSMQLSVREGEVIYLKGNQSEKLHYQAEQQVLISSQSTGKVKSVSTNDPSWQWTQKLAPIFILEGHSLAEFLQWLSRENGWKLNYSNPGLERQASNNLLHGDIRGMNRQEMLTAVAAISKIRFNLEQDKLTIYPQ